MNSQTTTHDSSVTIKRALFEAVSILILLAVSINMAQASQTLHKTVTVQGQEVFYREAGVGNKQTIILLHGFPTSSHMYRNLIPKLSNKYHVLAPDYPGFGNSSMPSVNEFEYSFDNLAKVTISSQKKARTPISEI